MAVTIADIAERVKVTKTTVSKVLNKRASSVKISARTRQRVMEAVEELGYRPSFAARALARGKTHSFGLICGDIENPHSSELAKGVLQASEANGYHLVLSLTEWTSFEKDLSCLDMLLGRGVDGVIMSSTAMRPGVEQYKRIIRDKFPLVILRYKIPGLSSVGSDWNPGTDQMVAYLKAKGHRRIGLVAFENLAKETHDKGGAFFRACRRHEMAWVGYTQRTHLSTLDEGFKAGYELAQTQDLPSALMVPSDYAATGVIAGLQKGGLRVPDDVAVVGMDGTNAGACTYPTLTTIAQDRKQIAEKAVGLLLTRQDNRNLPPENIEIPTKLIVRDSA